MYEDDFNSELNFESPAFEVKAAFPYAALGEAKEGLLLKSVQYGSWTK
jgi:hypothetical protein